MVNMLLTPYDGAILGPIAKLLGWIMDGIYSVTSNVFGIENVGLSIILLTVVIYTLLLPLTIKQQKFSKLSQKMQPELKAIQEKYKNRRDEASVMAANQETQLLYSKYGISPTGSCVQLLIQMPILLALYRVFYNVPAYITTVKDKFTAIANEIYNYDGFAEILKEVTTDLKIVVKDLDLVVSETNTIENVKNYIVDILYKIPSVETLITPNADGEVYFESLSTVSNIVNAGIEEFYHFNHFFGLNISDTPWNIMTENFASKNFLLVIGALCIPVFSYLSQVLSIKLSTARNKSNSSTPANDAMTQQMEMMNKMMPLMSLFFCFTMPVGLGIYWIISAVVRTIQMIIINKYIDNMDLDDVIRKNEEKAKAKREKMGIYENQIRNAAAMNTRNVTNRHSVNISSDKEAQLSRALELKANARQGSLAAKANMVKEYNERNSRK
uniref:YidC/Oxa1 family membrane protein insertase n=1 Tax=Agathobacter sp. TaxID=2021311 RepID=UPI004057648E